MIKTRNTRSDFEKFIDDYQRANPSFKLALPKMREMLVQNFEEFERVQLIAPRQAGTTTLLALYSLFVALRTETKIQIVLPSFAMISDFMRTLKDLSHRVKQAVAVKSQNRLVFFNGSIIDLKTPQALLNAPCVRDLTIVEHLATLPQNIQEQLLYDLHSRSIKYIIAGQPNGSSNSFAKLWFEAQVKKNFVRAIRISPEEVFDDGTLKFYEVLLGSAVYKIEFEGQFVDLA